MDKLATEDIEQKLTERPDWSMTGDALQRTFRFNGFLEAMAFVNRVAEVAERHEHHPDIMVRFDKVTLTLITRDASGVTDRDFGFAEEIDASFATS